MGDSDRATALEADALTFPEERGEILLEAAAAWSRACESERATRLLEGLIGAGGEDGCYARVQLVEVLLGADRTAEANLQLEALKRDAALHDGHCQLVAELLAERGVPAIRVVSATVAGLMAFANRVSRDQPESEVRARAWPPPRNGRCWCGSTLKYKKCRGRAH